MSDSVDLDHNGLEVLDSVESFRLLNSARIGRLGLSIDGKPLVLPVNFVAEPDRILIRTTAGTKLTAALRHTAVAFEVDDFDPMYHTGWSVIVTGTASEVTDHDDLSPRVNTHLARWAPVTGHHVIAISIEQISGRRLVHVHR